MLIVFHESYMFPLKAEILLEYNCFFNFIFTVFTFCLVSVCDSTKTEDLLLKATFFVLILACIRFLRPSSFQKQYFLKKLIFPFWPCLLMFCLTIPFSLHTLVTSLREPTSLKFFNFRVIITLWPMAAAQLNFRVQ